MEDELSAKARPLIKVRARPQALGGAGVKAAADVTLGLRLVLVDSSLALRRLCASNCAVIASTMSRAPKRPGAANDPPCTESSEGWTPVPRMGQR
jgi:hypothetical protein